MDLDSIKETFIIESSELLDSMEESLLELEKNPDDKEAVHAIFRAAHTIKGSGGMFGYKHIVDFTHVVETMLDKLRKGEGEINSDLIAILLESHDHIENLISLEVKQDNATLDETTSKKGKDILDRLVAFFGAKAEAPPQGSLVTENEKNNQNVTTETDQPGASDSVTKSSAQVENNCWHISLRFVEDALRHGLDPVSFISYLKNVGEIENLLTVTDMIPSAEEMDPESLYLGFEIDLKSDTDKETIVKVFEFLEEDCDLAVVPPHATIGDYADFVSRHSDTLDKLKQHLYDMGSITGEEMQAIEAFLEDEGSLEVQSPVTVEGTMQAETTEIIEPQKAAEEPQQTAQAEADAGNTPAAGAAAEKSSNKAIDEASKKSIRIDAEKLDQLINLVGELVITGANVRQLAEHTHDIELVEATSMMSRLIEEIRESAMNVRMVEIGDTFRRFERVVRDNSRDLGKKIDMKISGGDTELDKTLVEKITDPLVHLVRNSVDHGIETPEKRKESGKPERGNLRLEAFHDTGTIVIEVSDDGAGLNRDKILNKAIERGLASSVNEYTDAEVYQMIFEPGFSTADQVTNLSGRGVGMDVVRRNIESLRGTVEIDSQQGKGTTVRIRLPLTLAIIDGFLVTVGQSNYVVPLDMVLECVEISEEERLGKHGGNFVNLRGEVLPFLRLKDFFLDQGGDSSRENIIVVKFGRQKAGLVVDQLLGEFQTVIKPLGKMFDKLQGISGATILGDGKVALILDVPRLIKHAQTLESKDKDSSKKAMKV